jgi:Flp pilus assembly pilin Flp
MLRGSGGQTVVEYLLTTVLLVTVFAGMFGVLQNSLKKLFMAAGMMILTPRL